MLRLIIGPIHSGKTSEIFELIRADAAAGRRSILLVPEQISFAYEKRAAALGLPDAEALSFSRLSEIVLTRHGGDTRCRMTETASFFLMNLALEEVSDALTLYAGQSHTHGFLEQLVSFASECADAGITPEALSQFSFSQPRGVLRDKTADLSLILDAYLAIVHRGHISDSDVMTQAARILDESPDFAGASIYVEAFSSFTAPEYRLMEALMRQAETFTVSFIGDGAIPPAPAYETSALTAKRLIRMAEKNNIQSEHRILKKAKTRLPQVMLAALRDGEIPQEGETHECVTTHLAEDPAKEADYVAAKCAELIYSHGLRCRDIAIVMRDWGRYKTFLPAALSRCNLPFFADLRTQDRSAVLLRGVTDAILVAAGDRRGEFLSVLKSPLLALDPIAVGETENYAAVWSVRTGDWFLPFQNNPDGMRDEMTDEQQERLERINTCRAAAAEPLSKLRNALRTQSGIRAAHGIYSFLEEIHAAENLEKFAEPMGDIPRITFLQQQSQLWEQLMDVLDLFAAVPEEITLTPERTVELIELALSTCEVALPPQTLDEIIVGTADRMRIDDAKAVFLMGATEGDFPLVSTPGGLLSDDERRALVESGMTLLADFDNLSRQERLRCMIVASAAQERLFVTAPARELTGEVKSPSELFETAVRFSHSDTVMPMPATAACALREYAAAPEDDERTATLRRALEIAGYDTALSKIDSAAQKAPHGIVTAPLARRLFGDRLWLSPTSIEKYYRCPYSYFADKGMHVHALRKAEISPIESGTLIHRILEKVVSERGGKALADTSEADLRGDIMREIEGYISDTVTNPTAITKRMRAGIIRIGDWVYELLCRLGEEFSQSEFEPIAFELPIGEGGEVGGLRLVTADGCEISVHGTVDRADIATIGGKRYVRIIDYKSGGKNFSLTDVFYGLNLQMLVYLFSVWKHGHREMRGLLPAGVLYMPALGKYVGGADAKRGETNSLAEQYRMNGLLLDDAAVIRAMEPDSAGIFIPVKNGKPDAKAATVANLAQMGHLCALIEERIKDMAQGLRAGEIAAKPVSSGKINPCKYCDYRTVCGFEQGDPVRELLQVDRDIILGEDENLNGADE